MVTSGQLAGAGQEEGSGVAGRSGVDAPPSNPQHSPPQSPTPSTGKPATDKSARESPSANLEVAALYIDRRGCYRAVEGIDLWDIERDARKYAGPFPVVAHPPCERWGDCWHACRPVGHPKRGKLGDDKGCFTMALYAVRTFGGVIEHPADSYAFGAHGIPPPSSRDGWQKVIDGGWICRVEQGHYGHKSRKPTWLYFCAQDRRKAPSELIWGPSSAPTPFRNLSKEQRRRTPPAFRDVLLDLARHAQ